MYLHIKTTSHILFCISTHLHNLTTSRQCPVQVTFCPCDCIFAESFSDLLIGGVPAMSQADRYTKAATNGKYISSSHIRL